MSVIFLFWVGVAIIADKIIDNIKNTSYLAYVEDH